jgi:hypothetical protein
MPRKIDFEKDSNLKDDSNIFLKENTPIALTFLDNGMVDDYNLNGKIIDKFIFRVIDLSDNKEKELSSLSKRFIKACKPFAPLKDKSLLIRKFRFGPTEFDIDFEIRKA